MLPLLAMDPNSIEENDCKQLKSELESAYPGIEEMEITDGELYSMCQACAEGNLILPYMHIRPFVVAYIYHTRVDPQITEDGALVIQTLQMVQLQSGMKPQPPPMVPGDSIRTLIHTMAESLQQVLDHSIEQNKSVAESQGNAVVADALPKVFEKWGTTFDVEVTKVYGAQVFRYLAYMVLPAVTKDLHKALKARISMFRALEAGWDMGEDQG
ncbi:hypothetical protein HBH99_255990 [Parastagonospora nodorum]|nr:hypothetical protein HBH99_255990 [Parastagonospora nodorum]